MRVDLDQMNSAYYYDEQGNVVETDLASRFGVPNMSGVIWIEYDYEEATRPVTKEELPNLSEESVAIRLIVSEVGADRLVTNRNGLLEGVGICWTVENRLIEEVYRPGPQPQRPYGGGGESGTFISAATSGTQFTGLNTSMGLDPRAFSSGYVSEGDFKRALDIAAVAYEMQSGNNPAGLEIPDITKGATVGAVEYRHQCGPPGEDVYGEYAPSCDEPAEIAAGADPYKGPLVFKAKDPRNYNEEGGYYGLMETGVKIDYVPRE